MTTPVWLTGFNYGLETPTINGAGLFTVVSGTTEIVSTNKRRTGGRALHVVSAGYAGYSTGAGITHRVGRFSFWCETALPSTRTKIFRQSIVGGIDLDMYLNDSGVLTFEWNSVVQTYSETIQTGTVYHVNYECDVSTTSFYCNWQVNGAAQTQIQTTSSASTVSTMYWGFIDAATGDTYFTDIIISNTGADYPIGDSDVHVMGLRPNQDGSHNAGTNIMEDSAGNDINGTSVFAYDKLDENPWMSTGSVDYVRQTANGVGNYCEIQYADISGTSSIVGVIGLLEYMSASSSPNTGGCIIRRSDNTEITLWGVSGSLADYSEASAFYKNAIVAPPGGGWTESEVNALRCRFGYSGDANPDPYWLALMLEVAYTVEEGTTLVVQGSNHSHSADSATITQTYILNVQECVHAHAAESPSLTQVSTLVVQESSHSHSTESPTLTSVQVLVVQSCYHTHSNESQSEYVQRLRNRFGDTLVGLWTLNDSGGMVSDSSDYGFSGTYTNIQFNNDPSVFVGGNAPYFNGTAYADVFSAMLGSTIGANLGTLAIFAYPSSTGTIALGFFRSLAQAWGIWLENDYENNGVIEYDLGDEFLRSYPPLHAGWNHLATTWATDDDIAIAYFDGKFYESASITGSWAGGQLDNARIGTDTIASLYKWKGWLANVVALNYPASTEDMLAIFTYNVTLEQIYSLEVQSSLHAHSSDEATLIQTSTLEVQESSHAHSAENTTLTLGAIDLIVQESSHSHSAENATLTQVYVLEVQGSSHAHSADSPVITQVYILSVDETIHAHLAENATLTQIYILIAQESLHSHSAETAALIQTYILTVQESIHSHAAENATISQTYVLVISETFHNHLAENATLVQTYSLLADGTVHAHSAESAELSGAAFLDVQSSIHAHTADEASYTQTYILSADGCIHAHNAENVTLAQIYSLIVDDTIHDHWVENVTIIQIASSTELGVTDASHSHTVDNVTLIQTYTLSVDGTLHSHVADNVTITQVHILTPDGTLHSHAAENVTLSVLAVLDVDDALHSHTADNVTLVAAVTNLIVAGCLHAHFADSTVISYSGMVDGVAIGSVTTLHSAIGSVTERGGTISEINSAAGVEADVF